MYISEQTDLDFKIKNGALISNVTKGDARNLFQNFLQTEYDYAVSTNLTNKDFSANTEIIVWHVLNDIYEFPRPLGYERKLAYDLINDFSANQELKKNWDPRS